MNKQQTRASQKGSVGQADSVTSMCQTGAAWLVVPGTFYCSRRRNLNILLFSSPSRQLMPYPLGISRDKYVNNLVTTQPKFFNHILIGSNKKMKNLLVIFLLFCFLFLFGCSKDNSEIIPTQNTPNNIEHSASGWELYSWKIEDHWKYSFLIGTNRLKTYEEVTTSKIVVTGEEKLKEILKLFTEGEHITWIGQGWLKRCWQSNFKNLELPPEIILEDIKQYCNEMKLILYVTD